MTALPGDAALRGDDLHGVAWYDAGLDFESDPGPDIEPGALAGGWLDGWAVYGACEGDDPHYIGFHAKPEDAELAIDECRDDDEPDTDPRPGVSRFLAILTPDGVFAANDYTVDTHEKLRTRVADTLREHELRPTPTLRRGNIKAWVCNVTDDRAHSTLATWLVNFPGAHAFWDHWILSVIHLRPVEGVPDANLTQPDATHEFITISMNPEHPAPDPDDPKTWKRLIPADLCKQVAGLTDLDARRILMQMVNRILCGDVSPDSDYRTFWGRALDQTASEFAAGAHPIN